MSSLLKNKMFYPTFWTQFLGAFNDNVFKNAIVILVTYKSLSLLEMGSKTTVFLAAGIFILPFFLFSSIAGEVADKFPKDRLIYYVKVWEVLVMIVGSIGFLIEDINLLIISLFLMGLQSTFFGPVKYSILPKIINEDELMRGNALFQMGTFVSIILGTILGGILISIEGSGKYYVSLSVILFAILGTLTSKGIHKLEANNPDIKINPNLFVSTFQILKITGKNTGVLISVLGISWFWFIGASLLSTFPPYVKETLLSDESVATVFLAIFSVGVGVGSMFCGKLSKGKLRLSFIPIGAIGMSGFLMLSSLISIPHYFTGELQTLSQFISQPHALPILACFFFVSMFGGFYIVPLYTYIQSHSDRKELSRVVAGNNILNAFFMVVASGFLISLGNAGFSNPQIFTSLAGLNIFIFIITLFCTNKAKKFDSKLF